MTTPNKYKYSDGNVILFFYFVTFDFHCRLIRKMFVINFLRKNFRSNDPHAIHGGENGIEGTAIVSRRRKTVFGKEENRKRLGPFLHNPLLQRLNKNYKQILLSVFNCVFFNTVVCQVVIIIK